MLYYNRTEVSGGSDVRKTSKPTERNICHYWNFLEKGSKFKPYVCNGSQEVLMISMNLAILLF